MLHPLLCLLSTVTLALAVKPPHIIHIMGDDVGWNDFGYRQMLHDGVAYTASPVMDRLAREGVQLTNHHAFKVCAPSRGSFHSGRLPWQMGYYDNSARATPWIHVDSNRMGTSRNFTLLPEVLNKAGYVSHAIGKWHLGHVTRAYTPTYRGYSSFLGYFDAMTEDYWLHTHSTGANAPGGCKGPLGGSWPGLSNDTGTTLSTSKDNSTYEATLFGDRAVQIIEQHGASHGNDKPLFMYLAFHNEHDPHQAPRDAIDAFDSAIKSDVYKVTAAQISTMDLQIGRVLEALNRTGMSDNVVVGFSSDKYLSPPS